ncbi:hypothetical protein [Actinacidiphila acididurans]|uniref:Uncharacterized protein n=1 Tax=Actinacidiphila acididurans TaxID=2784346 RepID=A0ABS2TTP3_9ACTN|nr:hypothetical protein [Actinacidiphila acididurans]MBM9506714.1 hypothetical protein [Actinacidiphila acididurans]
MPVYIPPLTSSQKQLLGHLALADFPHPDAEPASAAARGLDECRLRADIEELCNTRQVTVAEGHLSITELGVVAYLAAERDELAATLVDVSALADELRRRDPVSAVPHSLRQLAQGAWSLDQALAHLDPT